MPNDCKLIKSICPRCARGLLGTAAALAVLVIFSHFSPTRAETTNAPAQKPVELSQTNILSEEWKKGNIERILIVHIPYDVHFPVALSPTSLEDWAFFKLMVYEPKDRNITRELFARVENLNGTPSQEQQDLRWGFIFFDRKGERISSIYFNQFHTAVINGTNVILSSDDISKWASRTFGSVFR